MTQILFLYSNPIQIILLFALIIHKYRKNIGLLKIVKKLVPIHSCQHQVWPSGTLMIISLKGGGPIPMNLIMALDWNKLTVNLLWKTADPVMAATCFPAIQIIVNLVIHQHQIPPASMMWYPC